MEILVDYERAKQVFGLLLDAFERRIAPYDDLTNLGYAIPKSIRHDHVKLAIYFLCSCQYMRGKINSNTAFERLAALHEQSSWMFDPSHFMGISDEDADTHAMTIAQALQSVGLGFGSKQAGKMWVFNLRKLTDFWNGNPLLIFAEAQGNYDQICAIFINGGKKRDGVRVGFKGFREKMVSMLTYFYVRYGLVDSHTYPIPVDFHVLRMLVSHEILYVPGIVPGATISTDELSVPARQLSLDYCKEVGLDPERLADTLWHYSREFCVQHPGNKSTVGRYKGRGTDISFGSPPWTQAEHNAYHRTCGRCVVEKTCRWNIPSSNNYIQALISIRWERQKPFDLFVIQPSHD